MALGPLSALPLCLCVRPCVGVETDTRHPILLDTKNDERPTVVLPIVLHAIADPRTIPFVALSVWVLLLGRPSLCPSAGSVGWMRDLGVLVELQAVEEDWPPSLPLLPVLLVSRVELVVSVSALELGLQGA